MFDPAVIDRMAVDRPDLLSLAESVSFAVMIDRVLLRAARLHFLPQSDAGLEADLWFAPLVRTRSTDGVTLIPDAANALRKRVAADAQRLADVWKFTTAMHAYLPPTLKQEEQIAYLSVSPDPDATQQIEALLRSALAAIVDGGRAQLANWSARALANLPTAVRMLPAARLLDAGARLHLSGDAGAAQQTDAAILPWLAPSAMARDPIGVRFTATGLFFDATPEPRGEKMLVPRTRPLLLTVSWNASKNEPRSAQVTIRRGEEASVELTANEATVTTLSGEAYSLRRGGTTPETLASCVIDFKEVIGARARVSPNQETFDAIIFRIEEGSGKRQLITVSGPPGSGKTTLLAHLASVLETKTDVFTHFFEAGSPRLEDYELARRSLIAQMISRYNFDPSMLSTPLGEFMRSLARRNSQRTTVIILDGLDQMIEDDPTDALFSLAELPPHVFVVASLTRLTKVSPAQVSFELGEQRDLRHPMLVGELEVIQKSASRFLKTVLTSFEDILKSSPVMHPFLKTLSVAKAPVPRALAETIARDDDVSDPANSPFVATVTHQGEPAVAIVNGAAVEYLRPRDPKELVARNKRIAEVVAPESAPAEVFSWYGLMHGPEHWRQAGRPDLADRQLGHADLLRRRIEMFGARITSNYIGGHTPPLSVVKAALRRNERRLDAEPAELVPLLHSALREAGMDDRTVLKTISISEESLPTLRMSRRERGTGGDLRLPARVSMLRTLPKRSLLAALENDSLYAFQPIGDFSSAVLLGSHPDRITALAGANDWAASASADGSLFFWNMKVRSLDLRVDAHQGEILALLANDDDCYSCGADGTVAAWQLTRGSRSTGERWSLRWRAQIGSPVTAASLGSPFALLYAGCRDGMIATVQTKGGGVVSRIPAHRGAVVALATNRPAIISAGADRMLRLQLGEETTLIPTEHLLGIGGITVSPLRKVVATWSADRTARLFSIRPGAAPTPLVVTPHSAAITAAAFVTSDALLTCSADGTACISRTSGDIVVRFEEHDAPIRAAATVWFKQSNVDVVTASDDRRIFAWSSRDGQIAPGGRKAVTRISALRGGGLVIARGNDVEVRTGRRVQIIRAATFSVSANGQRLAIAQRRRIRLVRILKSGTLPYRIFAPLEPSRLVANTGDVVFAAGRSWIEYSGDRRRRHPQTSRITVLEPLQQVDGVVRGNAAGEVRLTAYDSSVDLLCTHGGAVTAIAESPYENEKWGVSAGADGSIIMWKLDGGARVEMRKASIVRINHIAFLKGAIVCGGNNGSLDIISVRDARVLMHIEAHRDAVTGLRVDRRREVFFSAAADATVRAWTYEGSPRGTFYGDVPFTALALSDNDIVAGDEGGGLTWLSFGATLPPPPLPRKKVTAHPKRKQLARKVNRKSSRRK